MIPQHLLMHPSSYLKERAFILKSLIDMVDCNIISAQQFGEESDNLLNWAVFDVLSKDDNEITEVAWNELIEIAIAVYSAH